MVAKLSVVLPNGHLQESDQQQSQEPLSVCSVVERKVGSWEQGRQHSLRHWAIIVLHNMHCM
jgi:hypothetical protein